MKSFEDGWTEPTTIGLEDGDARGEDTSGWLELFSAAVCLADPSLKVAAANAGARALLDDGASSLKGLINRSTERNAAALQAEAAKAIATGRRAMVPLRTRQMELMIWIVPAVRSGPSPFSLVFLLPLAGEAAPVVSHLRQIYKLSQAEADIAAAAACGMEVAQIAEVRGVSVHTLRAQIVSIKAKMGLTRLTEVATIVSRIHAATTWF